LEDTLAEDNLDLQSRWGIGAEVLTQKPATHDMSLEQPMTREMQSCTFVTSSSLEHALRPHCQVTLERTISVNRGTMGFHI